MDKMFTTPPKSPTTHRTRVVDTSERVASTPKRTPSNKGKNRSTGDDKDFIETKAKVQGDATEHIPAISSDALLSATADIDNHENSDALNGGEHDVDAEPPHDMITSRVAFLRGEDSDSELSDDPAPYADRKPVNKELSEYEKFTPHDTDPTKINAIFRMRMPDGSGWYIQKDIIPEVRRSAEEEKYGENDGIFSASLEACKVPRKYKEKHDSSEPRWVKADGHRWERSFEGKTEVFVVKIVHRRFNARTHKYEQIYFGKSKLNDIDPNDKQWVYAYNKWIDQIVRRSDANYVQTTLREHWKPEEICAMYTGFNAFFHANGIDAYTRISSDDLQTMLDAVNAVGGHNRGLDALRGQMNSAHGGKNPSLAYLRDHLPLLKDYIDDGGILSQHERFPEQFIPEEEFPKGPRKNACRTTVDGTRLKPKGGDPKYKSIGTQNGDYSNVMKVDTGGVAITNSPSSLVSNKRKRGASTSASDGEETPNMLEDQSEYERGISGKGGQASNSGRKQRRAEESEDDQEYHSKPQTKKQRIGNGI